MAIAVYHYSQLRNNQDIHHDPIAKVFASNQMKDDNRGYGSNCKVGFKSDGGGEELESMPRFFNIFKGQVSYSLFFN